MVENPKKYDERKPEEVGSDFRQVVNYATDKDGVVDLAKIDSFEGRYSHLPGRNRRCDVLHGPCACGAWH